MAIRVEPRFLNSYRNALVRKTGTIEARKLKDGWVGILRVDGRKTPAFKTFPQFTKKSAVDICVAVAVGNGVNTWAKEVR